MSKKTEKNKIELYFEWWLKEMMSNGYIKDYYREPETLVVEESIEYGRYKRFKRKEKEIESFNLFQEVKYTYDYIIIWNESAEYLFYEEILYAKVFSFGKPLFIAHRVERNNIEETVSYIDVKPTNSVVQRGGKVSSAISFVYKQRMAWENLNIYINKVVPIPMAGTGFKSALFIKSFTPQRYLLTDVSGAARKINFPVVNLYTYTKLKKEQIDNLLKNTI